MAALVHTSKKFKDGISVYLRAGKSSNGDRVFAPEFDLEIAHGTSNVTLVRNVAIEDVCLRGPDTAFASTRIDSPSRHTGPAA